MTQVLVEEEGVNGRVLGAAGGGTSGRACRGWTGGPGNALRDSALLSREMVFTSPLQCPAGTTEQELVCEPIGEIRVDV